MPPKKPSLSAWTLCEKCGTNMITKDVNLHIEHCPPSTQVLAHNFIQNNVLYGTLDVKSNEDIKGLSRDDVDNLVFLSQSAIQLCEVVIGEWCQLQLLEDQKSCARIVWPTVEKSATTVMLTKQSLALAFGQPNQNVKVKKIETPIANAKRIILTAANKARVDLSHELQMRLHKTYLNRLLTLGNNVGVLFYGKYVKFHVETIESVGSDDLNEKFEKLNVENTFHQVVDETQWMFYNTKEEYTKSISTNPLDKFGGLNEQINEIEYLMKIADADSRFASFQCKTVLLYGASGTGKTTLAENLAQNAHSSAIIRISLPIIYSKVHADTPEDSLELLLERARAQTHSIVLVDDLDLLCPIKTNRNNEFDKRIMSKMVQFFDAIHSDNQCTFVIATTNKIDSIDRTFRRFGRIDREIEIPTPTSAMRAQILQKLLADTAHTLTAEQLNEISLSAHGFVGADLLALCACASLAAHKHDATQLRTDDFAWALTQISPSAMREVQVEVPNVQWTDVGGQHNLKLILKQSVVWPLQHPEAFVRMGITPPKGILMFGPPGCSKTMIAQALATETHLNFLAIKGPELFSKWVGESERAVREIFRRARQVAPSVIFFDEIDALGGERSGGGGAGSNGGGGGGVQERVLTQLLTELDGITPLRNITVLAATNRPDKIDKALLRPGRLDRIVYVPLPDADTRREIFKLKLSKMPVHEIDCDDLVEKSNGYSGAEVNALCHEAALKALEENLEADKIERRHFEEAFKIVTPRTSINLVKMYENYIQL